MKAVTILKHLLPQPIREILYDWRYSGLPQPIRTVRPHTLLSELNLFFLQELARRLERSGTPGDFVECGVYRGGSAGILAYEAARSQCERKVWLYDSFAGMPVASERDGEASQAIAGQFVGSAAQTRRIMERLQIQERQYAIIPGWFDQTLPLAVKPPIALLHVDCDFYDPVKLTLETFYDSVVPGGYVVLNDYGYWQGCRIATDEFLQQIDPEGVLRPLQIDPDAYYFQKL